jgi:hypothetical protein
MGPNEDKWIYKPDYTYLGITTHTIECPKCGNKQTFQGDIPPKRCYLCDSINYDEALKKYKDYCLKKEN